MRSLIKDDNDSAKELLFSDESNREALLCRLVSCIVIFTRDTLLDDVIDVGFTSGDIAYFIFIYLFVF